MVLTAMFFQEYRKIIVVLGLVHRLVSDEHMHYVRVGTFLEIIFGDNFPANSNWHLSFYLNLANTIKILIQCHPNHVIGSTAGVWL